MPNHVHLILVPSDADGPRAALSEAHRRYSRGVNFREGWRGYLLQGRFASAPMDDRRRRLARQKPRRKPRLMAEGHAMLL
jgi:putative transposase